MMKKLLIVISLLMLSTSDGSTQWRKIADFFDTIHGNSEPVTCIYFIMDYDAPHVGFAGAAGDLYRTIDSGKSWTRCWQSNVNSGEDEFGDICFKDSMVGWFVFSGANAEVWRTEDGGNSWSILPATVSLFPMQAIHYFKSSNRLFVCRGDTMLVSSDLGNTWQVAIPYQINGISSFSDSVGIASGYFGPDVTDIDTDEGLIRTSDGGVNWVRSPDHPSLGIQPLAIPGSPTCFTCSTGRIRIYRSDDYGKNWELIKDFGSYLDPTGSHQIGRIGTGDIAGDLSRLYIQTDTGMYLSIDQGITWQFDGGPAAINSGQTHRFNTGKGITFAAMDTGTDYGSLWEEIWPQSGVTPSAAPAGPEVSVYPNPTAGVVTISGASGAVVVENVLGEAVLGGNSTGTTPQPPPLPLRSRGGGVQLDLSSLPAGTYFVRVETAGGIIVKRIIKE